MKIQFLGTRGNIEARTRLHYRHTVTVVAYKDTSIMIDCGSDWRGIFEKHVTPRAILLTHAHPDHAEGLKDGSAWPVYATKESWKIIDTYPIERRHVISTKPFSIGSLKIQAVRVKHSVRAPAVGYRISGGKVTIFCVHDLLDIPHKRNALHDIKLYIGDGATLTRPIVRYVDGVASGHASIKQQLEWCAKQSVRRAIFTHCGSQIVEDDERAARKKIVALGDEFGVDAKLAYDGMEIRLRN